MLVWNQPALVSPAERLGVLLQAWHPATTITCFFFSSEDRHQGAPVCTEQQQEQAHIGRFNFPSRLCMWGCTSSLQETEHTLTPCSCLELRNASIYTPRDWGLGKSYCYRRKPLHTLVLSTHKWVVGGQTIKGCMYLGPPALRHCKLVLLHFSYNSCSANICPLSAVHWLL